MAPNTVLVLYRTWQWAFSPRKRRGRRGTSMTLRRSTGLPRGKCSKGSTCESSVTARPHEEPS
eukprot:26420-Eustigmatos_ZCMA.PRE.1